MGPRNDPGTFGGNEKGSALVLVVKGMCMSDGNKRLVSDALRILHGARSLPPVEAAEALRPFLESMRREAFGDKLADASTAQLRNSCVALKTTTQPRTIFGKRPSRRR
jgi:hypothetical protein